jgi:hypothetical protein
MSEPSTFTMTTDELATATLDAVKARAVALEAPLRDEEAASLAQLINSARSGELGDIEALVTEEKYEAMLVQINAMTNEQLGQMLSMVKMMGGILQAAEEGADGSVDRMKNILEEQEVAAAAARAAVAAVAAVDTAAP